MLYDGLGYLIALIGLSFPSVGQYIWVYYSSGINILNLFLYYKTIADIQVRLFSPHIGRGVNIFHFAKTDCSVSGRRFQIRCFNAK
jgi:hypothetical protein